MLYHLQVQGAPVTGQTCRYHKHTCWDNRVKLTRLGSSRAALILMQFMHALEIIVLLSNTF